MHIDGDKSYPKGPLKLGFIFYDTLEQVDI